MPGKIDEKWDRPLARGSLPKRERESLAKAARITGITEEVVLRTFLEGCNSTETTSAVRILPPESKAWTERVCASYRMARRSAAGWQTLWERFPEEHKLFIKDWAAAHEARRRVGIGAEGKPGPWSGRDGWETEPEIPIHFKDTRSAGGKFEKRPVEPGYVTYNELVQREQFRPFRTASSQARVAIPSSHGLEVYDPADAEFVKRIGYSLYTVRGDPIPSRELSVAANTLASRALSRSLPTERIVELWLRVAPSGRDAARVDMRDPAQRCIAVGPDGWAIEPIGYPTFDPRAHMLPLPEPAPSGAAGGWTRVEGLWKFLRLPPPDGRSDQQLLALASLVLFVLAPASPKPVSVFNGEERIGKSTMAGCLQAMVDPSRTTVIKPPEQDEDLVNIAINHAVINLDNLSYIRGDTSDTIARLCTGVGLVKRELYSDTGEVAFNIRRWVILNGITAIPKLPDLLARVVFLDAQRPEHDIGPEQLTEEFREEHPALLAGLLDLAVGTARVLRDAPPEPCSEGMADYVRIGRAMAVAMGRPADDFLIAWRANVAAQGDAATEDPWIALLAEYFGRMVPGYAGVRPEDIASWINQERRTSLGKEVSGQHVGNAIARASRTLRRLGIRIGRRRDHGGRAVYARLDAVQEVLGSPGSQGLSVRNPDGESTDVRVADVSPLRPQETEVSAGDSGSQRRLRPGVEVSAGSQLGSQPPVPSVDDPLLSPQRPLFRKTGVEGAETAAGTADPGDIFGGRLTRADRARAAGVVDPPVALIWATEACSKCPVCKPPHGDPENCLCARCSPWGHSNWSAGDTPHFCGILP